MRRLRLLFRCGFVAAFLAVFLAALSSPSPAAASPPANDNFADAQAITSFPFSDSGDLSATTLEPGEPQICNGQIGTAWYTFTASSSAPITVDASGSDGQVAFNIWQSSGGGFGGLSFVGCGSALEQRQFTPQAGATYYIQTGSVNNRGFHLQLNVTQPPLPVPANDDCANARGPATKRAVLLQPARPAGLRQRRPFRRGVAGRCSSTPSSGTRTTQKRSRST